MVGCLSAWVLDCLAGWLCGWLGWLAGWLASWLAGWMDGWMDGWFPALSWSIGLLGLGEFSGLGPYVDVSQHCTSPNELQVKCCVLDDFRKAGSPATAGWSQAVVPCSASFWIAADGVCR